MILLDRLMIEEARVSVARMMELAGDRLAEQARREFPKRGPVLLSHGKGKNGGDGLAAARFLTTKGYEPRVYVVTEKLNGAPGEQLGIIRKWGIPLTSSLATLRE